MKKGEIHHFLMFWFFPTSQSPPQQPPPPKDTDSLQAKLKLGLPPPKKYWKHLTPSSITSPEDMTHLEHRSFRASTTGLTCLAISGAATEESSAWLAIGGAVHWRVFGGFL